MGLRYGHITISYTPYCFYVIHQSSFNGIIAAEPAKLQLSDFPYKIYDVTAYLKLLLQIISAFVLEDHFDYVEVYMIWQ